MKTNIMNNEREDFWTGKWATEKILKNDEVDHVTSLGTNYLSVSLKNNKNVNIATISLDKIYASDLEGIVNSNTIEFVLNVKKEPYINRTALEYAQKRNFGLGGLGDLFRAINNNNFRKYIHPEVQFILRGLRQHRKVSQVVRLDSRRYQVSRNSLPDVIVLALNDYDLTAEAVRSGIEKYGQCDVLLTSNPNCRPTTESLEAAEYIGIKILSWHQLLGALNNYEIK